MTELPIIRNIRRGLRLLSLVVFGVVPGLLISLLSLGLVLSGSMMWRFYWLLVAPAAVYGTYVLVRHVFGRSLEKSRSGMLSGSFSMLAFMFSPLLHELMEEYLQIPSPIENMGLAVFWSLIALFPLIVFAFLAIKS